jgi:hypothetical protein
VWLQVQVGLCNHDMDSPNSDAPRRSIAGEVIRLP